MKPFMDGNFLLETETAKALYHEYACKMPIFDYHCHLSAKEIFENVPIKSIGELWLKGDHYKWRMMRANAVPERSITGEASYYEKFKAYASCLKYAIGNPLYHWTHLELQRYFGIYEVLSEHTADAIWETANAVILGGGFTPQELILKSNVAALCTTNDPADSLEYHELLRQKNFPVKVLPALRPDNALSIEKPTFTQYVEELGLAAQEEITSFTDLKAALLKRFSAFEKCGCVAADHGFEAMPFVDLSEQKISVEAVFQKALHGEPLTPLEADGYKTSLMLFLAKEYKKRNWAMELHIGCNRSQNTRLVQQIGEATGFDSIGDYEVAYPLAKFMDSLEQEGKLPKTILFTLNAKDNWVLASLAGNYQNDEIASKIQFGTAWWMQDHKDGIEQQMQTLASLGLLGRFIGMLTDSRSFVSYPRHEYFRRILCNMIGNLMENGQYANDIKAAGQIVQDICFYNALNYFGVNC